MMDLLKIHLHPLALGVWAWVFLSLFTLIWSHLCTLPLFFFLYIRSNTVYHGMSYQFHKIIDVYWPIMNLQGSPTSIKKSVQAAGISWMWHIMACFLIIISAQTGYFMDVGCLLIRFAHALRLHNA